MNELDPSVESDPHQWLEEVTGQAALEWVRGHNAETVRRYAEGDRFERLRDELRDVLDADTRIPYVRRRGEYLYNFWRDADHPRGLWRRTTLDSYRTSEPEWDVLIDVERHQAAPRSAAQQRGDHDEPNGRRRSHADDHRRPARAT